MMHVDGEPLECGKEINVKIFPKGLKVFAPENISKSGKGKDRDNMIDAVNRWLNV